MDAINLIIALEKLADEHQVDPTVLATSLADSLYVEVMRYAQTPDAYVALDLDTGKLTLTALPASSEPFEVSLFDLGRRGVVAIKKSFDSIINQARVEEVAGLLSESTGLVVYGNILKASADTAIVELPGGVEGELRAQDAPGVNLRTRSSRGSSKIAVLITGDIELSGGTPRAKLSRKGTDFIIQLLTQAVPSIADQSIEILTIAREAGARTKILINSESKFSDPVALVIGTGGSTIRKVTDEVAPERLDVILSGKIEEVVADALLPGKVFKVTDVDNIVTAWVLPDQRASAFGKSGINIRLASMLVKRRIEIKSPSSN